MTVELTALGDFAADDYARLAGGSFFTSRGFLELWRAKGGRPVVWSVEADGRTAAILPGVEFGFPPFGRFTAMPDGCYGGLRLDPAMESRRAALAAPLLRAIARRGYGRVHVFDFWRTIPADPQFSQLREQTRLVDIADPDWAPPDAGLRSQIRKAEREGVRVETFDPGRHLERFIALSAATYRRHGMRPRYGRRFFESLAALARMDPRVVWRWCERDGRAVCSHVYFIDGDTLQAWQSYFDRAFSFLKPNAYIRFTTCREFALRGVAWLNLGSTPVGAAGLEYFKGRWGGRQVEVTGLVRFQGAGALAESWRRRRRRPRAGMPPLSSPAGPRPLLPAGDLVGRASVDSLGTR